jgi:uncharacterized protein YecE (DUF72 family)
MALDPTRRDHYPAERRRRAEALASRAPRPARVGAVRLGTASWTDPTLLQSGLFYPPGATTAEKRLRHYASHFDLVEVDASYYALPTARQAQAWADRTPPGFTFHVKAFASITGHPVDLERLPGDLREALPAGLRRRRRARPDELPPGLTGELRRRFVDALEPLRQAGKLGAILLQFPPWLTATRAAVGQVLACREQLGDLPLAVEFRHASWVDPGRRARVFDLLREHEMAYVAVDTPEVGETSLPPLAEATWPPLAVVRFHGRNRTTWAGRRTAAERFDHLYEEQELASWVRPLLGLSREAGQVHVLMNNCTYDAGVLGAKGLAALLAGSSPLEGGGLGLGTGET